MNREDYPTVDESTLQGVVRTNLDSPEPTKAQLDRKARSIALIRQMGLPYMDNLPVVEDERQTTPRLPEQVAKRCIAVALCAVKGETQGNDEALISNLVKMYGAQSFFSPEEAVFIDNPSPEPQQLIDFCWRYECVHVFLWALGHIDELKPPNIICDVPHDVGIIRDTGPDDFVEKARSRDQAEILDMADLYYRLHWAAIELRLQGKKSEIIDEGIVRERHRALNWLIGYMGQKWDDVSTDT